MRRTDQQIKDLNEKCSLLMSLGFDVEHEDSQVSFNGVLMDFSRTPANVKDIIETALVSMFKDGVKEGKKRLQLSLKQLLTPEEE